MTGTINGYKSMATINVSELPSCSIRRRPNQPGYYDARQCQMCKFTETKIQARNHITEEVQCKFEE